MKNTTEQPLKQKWTGPIDEWEIQFGLNVLILNLRYNRINVHCLYETFTISHTFPFIFCTFHAIEAATDS